MPPAAGRRVCLGGTFDPLHVGHHALLARAFEAGEAVLIGLTSDAMVRDKAGDVAPLGERKAALEAFLADRGWRAYEIAELEDPFGPAAHRKDLDAIVVSPETEPTARELNAARQARGLPRLEVLPVPWVVAQDGLPVTSTRIRLGEIDAAGRLLRPLRVRVGSRNPVKVEAVRRVLQRLGYEAEVAGVEVEPGVPPQPRGAEAFAGARNRARRALGDGDLGVGVEAGLLEFGGVGPLDVQVCAVVDRGGHVTVGTGPGFLHPPAVLRRVAEGGTVGEAMEDLAGVEGIGRKEGAIGFLTEGRMDRGELTESAVLMAMVPRVRRDLYAEGAAENG